jgi:hypothetical protein
MNVDFTDPLNEIVLEEMETLGKIWVLDSKNWHSVFTTSLKRLFLFPLADEKWTYWVFMQPDAVWPVSQMTPKQLFILRFAKLISHNNPKKIYVDRGFGLDPEKPDRSFSVEETALGLKLWAKGFENKVFKKMIKSLDKFVLKGAKRIQKVCLEYYGEECTLMESREIFYTRMLRLSAANAINVPNFTNKAISLLRHLYRV